MVKVIISLLAILLSCHSYALTKVSASVDKNLTMANESLILTITANDDVDRNALDTSALLTDFIVGRTSVSSQTSMINFDTTRTTTWSTVLIPRNSGELIIPAFDINGVKTQAITINSLAANESATSNQQDLFITTQVSATDLYVQQQITLTVKLHFAAELKRGSLSEPSLISANILQIGKDKESESIIKGKRYRVIERVYAISPQKSGDMIVKAPVFSGEIIMPSARRSNFLSFADTKPVSVVGDDIALTVKAIPTQVNGLWLPSELFALQQEFQPAPREFKVGEPITRTITLTAVGLSEEQLPEITMQVPQGLKVYPDQAKLHTGLNNQRLVSQKVVNFAIVASKAGEYQLPEINIPWWNTVTNKAEVATIAGQKIIVLPNADIAPSTMQQPPSINLENPTTPRVVESVIIQQNTFLQWLFLALWLLTLLAWYITAKRPFKPKQANSETNTKVNNAHLTILAACKKNNGELALACLLPWARSQPQSSGSNESQALTTLDSLHDYFNDPALSNAIIELQQSYYGKSPSPWSGKNLLDAIQALNKSKFSKSPSADISINP
ncbi:BatD family protein [Colwellia sp. C1TZA3]|uniref:BatD family protein n=1 Tax=Colwellia sp. C1TZA3 TaxID=2508879 RepID=UPI001CB92898|nr:BatD family protein [Colwellia sp. C1TZA3]